MIGRGTWLAVCTCLTNRPLRALPYPLIASSLEEPLLEEPLLEELLLEELLLEELLLEGLEPARGDVAIAWYIAVMPCVLLCLLQDIIRGP